MLTSYAFVPAFSPCDRPSCLAPSPRRPRWGVRASAAVAVFSPVAERGRTAREAAFSSYRHGADAVDLPMEVCEGAIPDWLRGTYCRNGPGLFEVGGRKLEHWFDGYAMLTKVALEPRQPPRLSTRFVESDAYQAARRGEMRYAEFMTPQVPPGSGPLGVLKGFASLALGDPTDNACVNLARRGPSLQAMTETQRSWVEVAPDTLATLRKVAWEGPSVGQLSTAHAQRDPAGGGWVNVGTEIAPPLWSQYHVFRTADDSPQRREILCSIPCADGAAPYWLHSFGLTREHVVVVEQPAAYNVAAMLGLGKASHGSVDWRAAEGTRLHVLHRASGALRTVTVRPAFFFFHVANALDTADGGVALDLCAFDDPTILSALRLDALTDAAAARDLPTSRLTRIALPPAAADGADGADGGAAGAEPTPTPTLRPLDDEAMTGGFVDLCSVAPAAVGDPEYRYVYSIAAARPTAVANRIVKSDVSGGGGGAAFEAEGGQMLPGEPLFVPRPGGDAEDDGVVLSLGTDADGGSSLYVLDASDLRLLARVRSPIGLPAGFHGHFEPWGGD